MELNFQSLINKNEYVKFGRKTEHDSTINQKSVRELDEGNIDLKNIYSCKGIQFKKKKIKIQLKKIQKSENNKQHKHYHKNTALISEIIEERMIFY